MHRKKIFLGVISIVCLLLAQGAFAKDIKKEKPLLNIAGISVIDQIEHISKAQDRAATNGALLRNAGLEFSYNLNESIRFNLELSIFASGIGLGTLFLHFKNVSENFDVMIGQVPSPSTLENSESSKWLTFSEKSLHALFKPSLGPGVNISYHHNNWAIKAAASQTTLGVSVDGISYSEAHQDAWSGSVRGTIAPLNKNHQTVHLGLSAFLQDIDGENQQNLISFEATEVAGRNTPKSVQVLELAVDHYTVFGFELGLKSGPWLFESEAVINSLRMRSSSIQTFWGSHAQISYFLTGQEKSYHVERGSFGAPDRSHVGKYGIWEAGLRYSYLNLTKKSDVIDNTGKNITASLVWYPKVSDMLKFSLNYVHANSSNRDSEKKTLGSLVMRMQVLI